MPMTVSLSRAILSLAAKVAPQNRQALCQAIRAELDVLDEGRLSWAIGGLASALGWRMRVDGLFWGVVLALAVGGDFLLSYIDLPVTRVISDWDAPFIYSYWLFKDGLLCALLAFWRPELGVGAAIALCLLRQLSSTLTWIYVLHWSTKGVHVMDASPVVGISAIMCWCLIGAWAGASLRRTFAKPAL